MSNKNHRKFTKKVLAISILSCIFTQAYALDTSVNGYGENTPTKDNTGYNYENMGGNPYVDTVNGTNDLKGELKELIGDNSFSINPSSFIGDETSSITLSNNTVTGDEYQVLNLEGNNVDGSAYETHTILTNDGPSSALVVYSNLANGVEITNDNGGTAWIKSNSANDAKITNTNSNIYINDNSVNGASLINNSGEFVINGNSAEGVTIVNNGTMFGSHNTATSANITNNIDGTMSFFGNDLASSRIKNDGTFTVGDCSVESSCRPGVTNGTNASNIELFENNGTLNISGNVNFNQSELVSTGIFNINNLNINSENESISSSGIINISGNNDIRAGINNVGVINVNEGNTYFNHNITGSTGIINLNKGSNFWVDDISAEASVVNLNNGANLYLRNIDLNANLNADNGTIYFDAGDDQNLINVQGEFTGKANLVVENVSGNRSDIQVMTTANSDGELKLKDNYLTSGAYEYSLLKASNETNDEWWLTNHDASGRTIYSANLGSYLANAKLANNLFTSRLEDREGSTTADNNARKPGNVWIRAFGGHDKFKSQSDQLKTSGDFYTAQLGVALATFGAQEQIDVGLMGGYAHYSGDTRSNITNKKSSTKLDGYSVGVYGTWYANPQEKTGAYLDGWVLWNDFKNKVDLSNGPRIKYDSSGITASLEAGGNYQLTETIGIQPQAQLIYQGVQADDFRDLQNNKVTHASDNLQTRIGVKSYIDINANGQYRPYVALNWIHNTEDSQVNIADQAYGIDGYDNLGEFKLGVEGTITPSSRVWANVAYQRGSHSAENYVGGVGLKWLF